MLIVPWESEIDLQIPTLHHAQELMRFRWDIEKQKLESVESSSEEQTSSSNDTGTEKEDQNSMFDIVNESIQTQRVERGELDIYLEEQKAPSHIQPLEFWKINNGRFPILSRIAKIILAIPATSAGIERVFSIAGNIAAARRARTSVKNMAAVLMIRQFKEYDLMKKAEKNSK